MIVIKMLNTKIIQLFHSDLDQLAKRFIDAGVNIDATDDNGDSPLSEGIFYIFCIYQLLCMFKDHFY